ncbi:MAG: fatty acid desaturase [Cyanobacteriota bacterium]|nr:fatty acid desaturase [Cyanobacteriota bacterium]
MEAVGKTVRIPREMQGAPAEFFNPTLVMFLASVVLSACCFAGYSVWDWPRWLVFWLNFLSLYVLGTVIHDASHGSAHRIFWLNEALGHGSALLQGFVYPVFKRVHLEHHAHVNDPQQDPDHYVSTGGPLWLIAPRFFYHEVYFFKRQLWRKGRWDLLEWILSRSVVVVTFSLAIHFGYTDYLMNYWLPPACIMGLLLGLFFDYLPHRPFEDQRRWHNARVYPGWITNILLLGQNYHLIHHLWPGIPWYQYQAAYGIAKPLLDKHGSKQTLGIWEGQQFWSFLYDVLIGIRWHSTDSKHHSLFSQHEQTESDPSNLDYLEMNAYD